MNQIEQNEMPFWRRFLIYQNERFPFLGHGILISAFTFSAISYSRICRGAEGFVDLSDFVIGVFATITLFFLVRIFDEFKDQEDDRQYRKYLPVPRGLISLRELKIIGIVVGMIQIGVIAFFQMQMLYLYVIVLLYLALMGVEFFVPAWLKKRQILYITSHMFIIPLIDLYASGIDWLLDGASPHWGLAWFFAVSYCNGLVLEFGRKIKTPEMEEEGVVSYTGLYGKNGGVVIWISLLFLTMILAICASHYANFGSIAILFLTLFFLIVSIPGWMFLKKGTPKMAKFIEYASALWTILMYLTLGAIPMIKSFIQ